MIEPPYPGAPRTAAGPPTVTDEAIAKAAERVGGHVSKGLQTVIGYGGGILAAIAVLVDPLVNPDLPNPVRVALLAVAAFLVASTGKNRSDQAAAKNIAAGQVIATAARVESEREVAAVAERMESSRQAASPATPPATLYEAELSQSPPVVVNVWSDKGRASLVEPGEVYAAQGAEPVEGDDEPLPDGGTRRPGEAL